MNELIEIATVQHSQMDVLRDIAQDTFVETFANANSAENIQAYVASSFSLKQIMQEFNTPHSHFFFASVGGDIAGYLKLNTSQAQTEQDLQNAMEIERIYARQAYQGQGVGKALMQKSISLARDAKLDWLWLGVWEMNLRAIEFYKRQGFQAFGQHDFFLGDELQRDVTMKLPIR